MYSCGSLAPKMGRGGGCSDCKFRRPPQPWELCDGCVYLINELSSIPEACTPVDSILPSLAKSLQHKHYTSHLVLYETVCKVLPNIAKGIGKKLFKSRLHLFLDPLFYSLVSSSFIFRPTRSEGLLSLPCRVRAPCVVRRSQVVRRGHSD